MSNTSKKNIVSRISGNTIARNLILGISAVIILVVAAALSLNAFTRHSSREIVPDFSEMSMDEALRAAKKGSLRIEVNDSVYVPAYDGGIVLDQLPKPGTEVKPGRRVFVTVNANKQRMVKIPYVTGYSLRKAKNNLEVAGLEIDKLIFKQDIAANNVLQQLYEGTVIGSGTEIKAEQGSGVTLVVGMDPEKPNQSVPKVVGFPLNEAKSRIWEAGFNVGEVTFDEGITLLNRNEAKVYEQSPEQGRRQSPGVVVSLKLALDQSKIDSGSKKSDSAAKRIITSQDAAEQARQNND